jgi:hypothetical protein
MGMRGNKEKVKEGREGERRQSIRG